MRMYEICEIIHWQETKLKHSLRLVISRGNGKPLLVMQKIRRYEEWRKQILSTRKRLKY